MSKKSPKKSLVPNPLNVNLFYDEVDQSEFLKSMSADQETGEQIGWLWELNKKGEYTACSPEVQDALGVNSRELLGNDFSSFRISPQSQPSVQSAINGRMFPAHVNASFIHPDKGHVEISLIIHQKLDPDNQVIGWQGSGKLLPRPETTKPPKPVVGLPTNLPIPIDSANALIPEIEENAIELPPPSPKSNGIKNHQEDAPSQDIEEISIPETDEGASSIDLSKELPKEITSLADIEIQESDAPTKRFMDSIPLEGEYPKDPLEEISEFLSAEASTQQETASTDLQESIENDPEDIDQPLVEDDAGPMDSSAAVTTDAPMDTLQFLEDISTQEQASPISDVDAEAQKNASTIEDSEIQLPDTDQDDNHDSDQPSIMEETLDPIQAAEIETASPKDPETELETLPEIEELTLTAASDEQITAESVDEGDSHAPAEDSLDELSGSLSQETDLESDIISDKQDTKPLVSGEALVTQTYRSPVTISSTNILEMINEGPDRDWTEEELNLVNEVTDQLNLALENAELFQRTQSALAETDVLYKASADLNAANSYQETIQIFEKHTTSGAEAYYFGINYFDTPWSKNNKPTWVDVLSKRSKGVKVQSPGKIKYENTAEIANNLITQDHYYVPELSRTPKLKQTVIDLFQGSFEPASAIFLPIRVGGEWHGYIDIYFSAPTNYPVEEMRRVSSLANQASEKILSILVNENEETRRRNADRLNQIARQFAEVDSEDQLTKMTLDLIADRINPDQYALYIWRQNETAFEVAERVLSVPNVHEDDYYVGNMVPAHERDDLYQVFSTQEPNYITQDWAEGFIKEQYLVPWMVADKSVGVIEIFNNSRSLTITENDKSFVEGLILQSSAAMERARLFEQTELARAVADDQAKRLAQLNLLSEELNQADSLEDVLDITAKNISNIIAASRISAGILKPDGEFLEVFALQGIQGAIPTGTEISMTGTQVGTAIRENRIINQPDLNKSPYEDSKLLLESGLLSTMNAPLYAGSRPIGSINLGSKDLNAFSERDENLLYSVSSLVSYNLENRRLFRTTESALAVTEEQTRRLGILNEMSDSLTQATTPEEIHRIAVSRTLEITLADRVSLGLLTPSREEYEVKVTSGDGSGALENEIIPLQGNILAAVNENRVVTDPHVESSDGTIHSTIVAPIVLAGKVSGTINISIDRENAFTNRDVNLMQQISSLLSGVLENNRLFTQIQRRSIQLETAAEVSQFASSILDTTQLLPRVVNLIKSGFDLYYVGIFLVDETGLWTGEPNKWASLQAATGDAGLEMLASGHKLEIGGDSMIGTAISSAEAKIALDVGEQAIFFRNPNLPNTRSEMALPLISRGAVLGALTIQSEKESAFTQEDITSLQTLANQVANTIENARLFEQTEQRAEELTVLNEMARSFTQSLEVDTIIQYTHQFTSRLMDADNFYLALYDAENDDLQFVLVMEEGHQVSYDLPKNRNGSGPTDWIISNKQPLLVEDNVGDNFRELGINPGGRMAESWVGVPMLRGTEVIGVIGVQSFDTPRHYGPRQRDLLSAVANQASITIDNARRFQAAQAKALREQLLREITANVHSSSDADTIMRTAVREISSALGREAYIQVGKKNDPPKPSITSVDPPAQDDDLDQFIEDETVEIDLQNPDIIGALDGLDEMIENIDPEQVDHNSEMPDPTDENTPLNETEIIESDPESKQDPDDTRNLES